VLRDLTTGPLRCFSGGLVVLGALLLSLIVSSVGLVPVAAQAEASIERSASQPTSDRGETEPMGDASDDDREDERDDDPEVEGIAVAAERCPDAGDLRVASGLVARRLRSGRACAPSAHTRTIERPPHA
jgi:hypothetical protein